MPERRKSKSGRRTVFRIVLIALLSVFIGVSLYMVNARRVFNSADVASLTSDDASLHLIIRQSNNRDCSLGNLIRREPLN